MSEEKKELEQDNTESNENDNKNTDHSGGNEEKGSDKNLENGNGSQDKDSQNQDESKNNESKKEDKQNQGSQLFEYELKLPKDSQLSVEKVSEVKEFAKTNKLTNEQAQAILERENAVIAGFKESQQAEYEAETKKWIDAVKSDKELGGEKFKETSEVARRAIEKLGSEAFKKALNDTGLGNHPELIRFAYNVGKILQDDKFEEGQSFKKGGRKSTAEVLFGPSK